jgi:citrate lyase subunit beta / citryl-CoA lyase
MPPHQVRSHDAPLEDDDIHIHSGKKADTLHSEHVLCRPDRMGGDATRAAVTYLFVPGHEPRKIARALTSGSRAVILDLEDAVPDAQKEDARRAVADYLAHHVVSAAPELWIRINATDPEFEQDVAAIDWTRAAGVVLPKAEDPRRIAHLQRAGATRVLPLIESVAGFAAVDVLTRDGGVDRLAIGTWDLALDLGLFTVDDPDDSELIWQLRADLVVHSRRLRLRPPVDGVCARLDSEAAFETVCRRAAALGYGGKLLIHPSQIAIARSTFTPDSAALESARRLVATYAAAASEGLGATRFEGRLIDRPMVERAKALLAFADGHAS